MRGNERRIAMKITIENIDVKKAIEILAKIETLIAPTILVEVNKNDKLKSPITIDGKCITELGIYEANGIKYWIVKKSSNDL